MTNFSEKEQKVLDFIKEKKKVTIKQIEKDLGQSYTGGIGKLIQAGLVEKKKKKTGEGYSMKTVQYYIYKEKSNE